MERKDDRLIAKEVTIENCLQYINAVGEAAKRDILDLPLEDRSFMLGVIKVTLQLTVLELDHLQASMEARGDATPITDEQRLHFQLMLQLAFREPEKS
jgi:hypothetical protein